MGQLPKFNTENENLKCIFCQKNRSNLKIRHFQGTLVKQVTSTKSVVESLFKMDVMIFMMKWGGSAGGGDICPPQILVDQLTLFQPGGKIPPTPYYWHPLPALLLLGQTILKRSLITNIVLLLKMRIQFGFFIVERFLEMDQEAHCQYLGKKIIWKIRCIKNGILLLWEKIVLVIEKKFWNSEG